MNVVSVCGTRGVRTLPFPRLRSEIGEAVLVASAGTDRTLLQVHCSPDFTFETISLGGAECHVAYRGVELHRPPRKGSTGSDAAYWVVQPFSAEKMLLLLQHLPPYARTSIHWHPKEHETFHALAGSCELIVGDAAQPENGGYRKLGSRKIDASARHGDRHVWVPPNTVHQLVTCVEHALNCIVIRNTDAQTLKEIDHQYTRWMS